MAEEVKRRIKLSNSWHEAKGLIIAHRWRLALGALLMFIDRLLGLVLPTSSKYIIDKVVVEGRGELLTPIALAIGAATLLQVTTSFTLSRMLGIAAERAINQLRHRVQAHIQRLPIRYFDSTQTGKLVSRIMIDVQGVRTLVGAGLIQLSGSIMTALISIGVLFYVNWRLTSITLIVLLMFGGGLAYAFRRLHGIFLESAEVFSQITGRLTQSLGGIRVVKAYTAEKREELIFVRGTHRLLRNIRSSITGVSIISAFSSILIAAVGMVIVLVGGKAVLSGQMTLGDLFMYVSFTGLMVAPVMDISTLGSQVTEAFAGLDRIHEVLSMPTEDDEDLSKEGITEIGGEIEFEDVWFEYDPGVPVLRNISFKAPGGSTTALVGSSGSGKSTLIGLIMNFDRPLSGKIKIDGRDLSMIKIRDYRSHLGVVLQDNFLFDGTIAENVSFARPLANQEEIRRVSRLAHCEEFIEGFNNKYETIVGERGVKLSGGQRQRVAIARALLADPKILILDEATSSLDIESEALIREGLHSLRQGRTTFVIAHRLSTIHSADQILVLEKGEIVERGAHETLLAAGGRYTELYDKQYKYEHNRFTNPGEEITPQSSNVEGECEAPAMQLVSL